jgi:G3E family GTPase
VFSAGAGGDAAVTRIAVAVVQGADGAGKTTLVNAQLARQGARRVARVSARCSADVATELGRLVATGHVDHAIVELGNADFGNGLGVDRATARRSFQLPSGEGRKVVVDYMCIVSVVDGACFLRDLVSEVHVFGEGPMRVESLAMMLVEQIEASTVIVVTKADLIPRASLNVLLAVVSELNPSARVVVAQHGSIPSFDLFDCSHAEVARALRDISRSDVLDPAAHERTLTGISSYVYRARRPFHPGRLHARVHQPWPGVLRSRGIFWLATRMEEAGLWSRAGSRWETSSGGFWWAALQQRGWPLPPSMEGAIRGNWQEPFGDRRQELTLIGVELDARALKAAFDDCLVSAGELAAGTDEWLELPDPFPSWAGAAADASHLPRSKLCGTTRAITIQAASAGTKTSTSVTSNAALRGRGRS